MNTLIRTSFRSAALGASALVALSVSASAIAAQQVFTTDIIVQGSACIGQDCVNGESFGFDTLRLKENNLRLHFQDTSTSASFPTADWRIVANDSGNGGASYLAVEDSTTGRQTFRVDQGAPLNSLRVGGQGNVGIGTASPVVELHVVDGDSPTLRLQQDGSSGFGTQTWDVAGNETNFFIRDATNGSTLPFRIIPGAPSNAIYVAADGDIGLNTTGPDGPLHIRRDSAYITLDDSNNSDKWYITHQEGDDGRLEFTSELNGSGTYTVAMVIEPDGDVGMGTATPDGPLHISRDSAYITLGDKDNNDKWFITHQEANDGRLEFTSELNSSGTYTLAMMVQPNGNATLAGTLTQNSDKNNKMAIEEIDTRSVLEKVSALPITSWTYKHDAEAGTRHIGPMAQDFYALFGTGHTEKGISTIDTSGVALAAIKALADENAKLSARLQKLEATFIK